MQFHVVRHVESGDAKNNYYGFQFDNNALCYTMTQCIIIKLESIVIVIMHCVILWHGTHKKKPRYTTILLTVNVSKICCSKIWRRQSHRITSGVAREKIPHAGQYKETKYTKKWPFRLTTKSLVNLQTVKSMKSYTVIRLLDVYMYFL